jgi:hypothetical protein
VVSVGIELSFWHDILDNKWACLGLAEKEARLFLLRSQRISNFP